MQRFSETEKIIGVFNEGQSFGVKQVQKIYIAIFREMFRAYRPEDTQSAHLESFTQMANVLGTVAQKSVHRSIGHEIHQRASIAKTP